MFSNRQQLNGHHTVLSRATLQDLAPPALLADNVNFVAESATPAVIYRNSAECRPYHRALHAFEGAQFGNDFNCESQNFEHWFNAEAYFCAAAFLPDNNEILSLIAMLFVTEASALELLNGKIAEQELIPHSDATNSPPVVYYSAMVAKSAMSSVLLYKSILRDINAYKSKIKIAPSWGFSIALTEKAIQHLGNSGFYPIEANFLNKYHILKIDSQSAQAKIWTAIFNQPAPLSATGRTAIIPAKPSATRRRYRTKRIGTDLLEPAGFVKAAIIGI